MYGCVGAPGAEMTSGWIAFGNDTVTLSKKGLEDLQLGEQTRGSRGHTHVPTTYVADTGSTG